MELEAEIDKFKQEVYTSVFDNENYIYLRLSALDNTIKNKDLQIKDAITKLRADFNKIVDKYPHLEKEGYKVFVEVKSAYKNSVRQEFINLYSNYLFKNVKIKDVIESNMLKDQKNLYVSSFDRLSRVFFNSLMFQLMRKKLGINIYSLIDEENKLELENIEIAQEDNNKQLLYVFQLMMYASSASKHSTDLSVKVKKRVSKNKAGQTISSKSHKKWGRDQTISEEMKFKIKDRFKRFSAGVIAQQPDIYQIKNNKRERISINTIYKIVRG